ncbi:MAG: HD domain-containing protein [Deltaproteobacteria bacterium]|nr:HD domain-containing protein [Deltaproteobacteria bacterium]
MNKEKSNFIKALLEKGAGVYEVGGTVRDRLLGLEHKDRDLLVTSLPLTELTHLLKNFGEVLLVGKSFGVIKFYPKGEPHESYDIALPRREMSSGPGHRDFEISFDPSLPAEIDLSRRDFTINAMAKEIATDRLVDPFNGQEDLRNRLLRMVSDKAFEEDPLRILRGIQFAARFQLTVEEKTYEAMSRNASLIKTISAERIAEEIRKLLSAEKPSFGFILMQKTGVLKDIFPELEENVGVKQGNKFQDDDVFMHTMRVLDASRKDTAIPYSGTLELMLSALYHDVGKARTQRFDPAKNRITFYCHQTVSRKMAKKRFEALKFSTIGLKTEETLNMIENHMFQTKSFFSERAIRRFINKIGPDVILKLVDLRIADNRGGRYPEGIRGVLKLRKRIGEELEKKTPFSIKDLAINGHDMMKLGVPEGPLIGKSLKELLEVVLDDPSKNTREELMKIAEEKIKKEKK